MTRPSSPSPTLFCSFAVVLLLGFTALALAQRPNEPVDCPIKESREAREQLYEHFYRVLDGFGYQLPEDCPLHKRHDFYVELEEKKKRIRDTKWKCRQCGKLFIAEEFIDKHILYKHNPHLEKNATNICLGSYCDILQCPSSPIIQELYSPTLCNAFKMERLRLQCKVVINKCFPLPSENQLAHSMNDIFSRQFCDVLNCSPKVHPDVKLMEHMVTHSRWNKLTVAIAVTLILLLFVYYGAVYFWKQELKISSDLKRLSTNRQESRLRLFKQQKRNIE